MKNEYPKEDKCRICGVHLGWMLSSIGEAISLGLCEDPQCQQIDQARKHTNGNSSHSTKEKKAEAGT